MASGGVALTREFIDRKQADLATVRWVQAQMPPASRLLAFGLTLTFRHYSPVQTVELFEEPSARLAGLLVDQRLTFLLLDVSDVERQWRGLTPAEDYDWLRAGPGLDRLGQRGPYTLFRIGAAGHHASRRRARRRGRPGSPRLRP